MKKRVPHIIVVTEKNPSLIYLKANVTAKYKFADQEDASSKRTRMMHPYWRRLH
jgi:hypothetical protein